MWWTETKSVDENSSLMTSLYLLLLYYHTVSVQLSAGTTTFLVY